MQFQPSQYFRHVTRVVVFTLTCYASLGSLQGAEPGKTVVLIVHGGGTTGQRSCAPGGLFYETVKQSATSLGYSIDHLSWTSGFLPASRIEGAEACAKKIIDHRKAGRKVIGIGSSYGGHVLKGAVRLIAGHHEQKDFFFKELQEATSTLYEKAYTMGKKGNTFALQFAQAWGIVDQTAQSVVSSTYDRWEDALNNVATYKKEHMPVPSGYVLENLITLATAADVPLFEVDMDHVKHYLNFYSTGDMLVELIGDHTIKPHARSANIRVKMEDEGWFNIDDPTHANLSAPKVVASWLLLIPETLKNNKVGGFEMFSYGYDGTIEFFDDPVKTPKYTVRKSTICGWIKKQWKQFKPKGS